MTKSELVRHIAERLRHLTQRDAEIIVDTIFESMSDALARGDDIEIRGFGSLRVKNRGARQGRNPKTGEPVHIPAKKLPLFRIGRDLYERINRTVSS
jgi:integration host factor beta subunit